MYGSCFSSVLSSCCWIGGSSKPSGGKKMPEPESCNLELDDDDDDDDEVARGFWLGMLPVEEASWK
jgi:hypothetical protein